jgi:hypothetical protein
MRVLLKATSLTLLRWDLNVIQSIFIIFYTVYYHTFVICYIYLTLFNCYLFIIHSISFTISYAVLL